MSKILYYSDILRSLGIFSIRKLRKYCGALCLLPSSLIFFMLSSVECNVKGVLSMICCATAFMGFNAAAFIPSFIDLTPAYRKSLWKSTFEINFFITIYCKLIYQLNDFSGFLHSVANIFFAIEGFLVPYFLGQMTSNDPYGTAGWAPVWLVCSGVAAVGALVFLAFGGIP